MRILSKHIFYPIVERVAHGSTFKCLETLQQSQWLAQQELKKLQEEQLRALISHAYENVPFYHKIFEERGLQPDIIRSIEDLDKVPILTRQHVRDNFNSLIARNCRRGMKLGATGGSTGEPLRFYMTKDEGWTWGAYYRGLGWYGFEPGDKMARIFGGVPHGSSVHRAANKFAQFSEGRISISALDLSEREMSQFALRLRSFQPKIILGYSSGVYIFAEYLRQHGIKHIRPKAVVTTSEKLFEHQRQSIRETFDCDVFEYYGCGEVLSIAYECPEHQGFHISAEKVILEVIRDDGSPCKPGELGKIVVTDLRNDAMPFIRYENGDVGALSVEACSCGRSLPLLKLIEGRVTDIVTTKYGHISAPVLTTIFKNLPVSQYQIVQETEVSILIRVVKSDKYSDEDTDYILGIMDKHLGPDVKVEISFVDEIAPSKSSGKRMVVISNVPPKFP